MRSALFFALLGMFSAPMFSFAQAPACPCGHVAHAPAPIPAPIVDQLVVLAMHVAPVEVAAPVCVRTGQSFTIACTQSFMPTISGTSSTDNKNQPAAELGWLA